LKLNKVLYHSEVPSCSSEGAKETQSVLLVIRISS